MSRLLYDISKFWLTRPPPLPAPHYPSLILSATPIPLWTGTFVSVAVSCWEASRVSVSNCCHAGSSRHLPSAKRCEFRMIVTSIIVIIRAQHY